MTETKEISAMGGATGMTETKEIAAMGGAATTLFYVTRSRSGGVITLSDIFLSSISLGLMIFASDISTVTGCVAEILGIV